MEALRDIARSGRTVIATLHQPRSDIFHLGDGYIILVKQGNVVFSGPREQMIPHFASLGHVCPPLYNPSDYVMDIVSVDVRGRRQLSTTTARIDTLIQAWRQRVKKAVEAFGETPAPADGLELVSEKEEKHPTRHGIEAGEGGETTPFYIAVPILLERSWRNMWRQPDLFWTRLQQAPILAICVRICSTISQVHLRANIIQ